MTHQIAVLCPSKSYFSRHSFYNLILFYLLFFFSTVNSHSCSVVLQVPAYNHPLPFPLLFFLFLSVSHPFHLYSPFPAFSFSSLALFLSSPLPSPSFPSPIPLFFWKSWLQQSAWNERCIPTHTLGAAAPSHVYANRCVCAHACVFASVAYELLAAAQQRGYVASCAQLILPHASYCHHYAKEFPAVSATAAHRVWVWRRERRRRIKRHAAKQHWQIEDRADFRVVFFSAKMCSACLRGKHYVCGIYCWPLCRWIVHICEKEHSVFMCVSDRACVCEWVIVWRVNVCSRCGLSGLAVCVLWCWRR